MINICSADKNRASQIENSKKNVGYNMHMSPAKLRVFFYMHGWKMVFEFNHGLGFNHESLLKSCLVKYPLPWLRTCGTHRCTQLYLKCRPIVFCLTNNMYIPGTDSKSRYCTGKEPKGLHVWSKCTEAHITMLYFMVILFWSWN